MWGDPQLLAKGLPGCDVVFRIAAVSSVQDSLDRPIGVHNTNLTATLALLEASVQHKVPRCVFSSRLLSMVTLVESRPART